MYRNFAFAAGAVIVSASGAAYAQDFSLEPSFGTVALDTGFEPDPYQVEIIAGGTVDAASVGCAGMIADAPDFRLNYNAGDIFPLIISVASADDTTLVINAPDGSWICDDDTDGLNPVVSLSSPLSGQYDIWVGDYEGGNAASVLSISEVE
ncbi:peptidase S1 [Ponticaulis sp.]|uniref:peptidase S1 n=1 Tax=Ponticaulis sp. TaxID=2020902 RepID=UPI000B728FEA|nr:peptidase S1 [Ponticaulis sp.]MAI89978.1 peptidase S1 [Ponticaulis sp.]OUX99642.1 MAG: peptidase S1 [Hyphomonadaceae bacterium TMED5]|tara:strand:+ start:29818 stop:30270 length:453 start_codon:yes stop_codon:yes gene_type:complete